jgi:Tfp pilus assembly PilM family ATPase
MIASVSVIPKNTIENFTEVCALAGLSPISFEMESQMVARSVVSKGDAGTFLIIDTKEDSVLLFLVVSGIVRFTSTISIDNSAMKENLLKKDVFSAINDEMKKFDGYLLSKSEGKGVLLPSMVDEIILCGSAAALPDFADNISKSTDKKVSLANVWSNVFDINNCLPCLSFENSLDFAAAIGLAI